MDKSIAERLISLRKQAGMSQEVLAAELGISRQAVSRWERGEVYPDTENLIALARMYGLSVDSLLGISDDSDLRTLGAGDAGAADAEGRCKRAIIVGGALLVAGIVVAALALLWPREKTFTGYVQGTVVATANYRGEAVLQLDKLAGSEGPHFVVCDLGGASVDPEDTAVEEGDEITVSYQYTSVDSVDDEDLPGRVSAKTVSIRASGTGE